MRTNTISHTGMVTCSCSSLTHVLTPASQRKGRVSAEGQEWVAVARVVSRGAIGWLGCDIISSLAQRRSAHSSDARPEGLCR